MKYRRAVAFSVIGAYLAAGTAARGGDDDGMASPDQLILVAVGVYTGSGKLGTPLPKIKNAVPAQPALTGVPFADGLSIQPSPPRETIFARQADGSYINLQFESTQPYSLLSPMSELTELFSSGAVNLFNAPPGPAGTGPQSQASALSGVDQNGSLAYAAAGGDGDSVSVSESYGGSTTLYPIGPDVNSVFFADFNGDGNPDLAVAYDGSGAVPGGIAILLNKGNGTFANPVAYGTHAPATEFFPAGGTPATHFAVLDLNHDGALDIATVSLAQTVTVLLGKGDGTFGSPTQYSLGTGSGGGSGQATAIADFNGDGNPDIVTGGTTGILLGSGDGTFRAGQPLPAVASGNLIWAFAAGDLNGDGKMDLVYADIENQVVASLFGNGDGTFQPGQAYTVSQLPDSVMLADFNRDGRLDIINGAGDARGFGPADQSGNTDILLNNGDGTFQGAPAFFSLPNAETTGYGFNGQNGLAVANFGGTSPGFLVSGVGELTLFTGKGNGSFQAPQAIPISGTSILDRPSDEQAFRFNERKDMNGDFGRFKSVVAKACR